MQRQLSENMMMRNKKTIIYFYLNRFKELLFREKENDVIIRVLIEYITENHDLKHVKFI